MRELWRGKRYWFQFFCLSLIIGVGFLFFNNVFDNFGQQIGQKISEFNFFKPVLAQNAGVFKVKGWAWSGTTGWISLSCANTNNCSGVGGSSYDLEVNSNTKKISGFAWSSNLGWICFGSSCDGNSPDGLISVANYLCEDTDGDCSADNYKAPMIGWAKIVNLGNKGWISLSCKNKISPVDIINHCLEPLPNYGVVVNFEDGILGAKTNATSDTNWAWQYAGGGAGNAYGTGWIQFNPDTEILAPYLQARGGDVFARKFTSFLPPPKGKYNAQYLIQSQTGISRFRACIDAGGNAIEGCRFGTYSALTVPGIKPVQDTINNPYSFKLGRFDFHNLVTPINGTSNRNRYGHLLVNTPPANLNILLDDKILENKVIKVNGDTTIGDITLNNGDTIVKSGAGTIVIQGDLNINGNINYQNISGSLDSKQLASVVWIVLGDVNIAPNVTDVAGNFIILGKRDIAICGGVNLVGDQIPQTCGLFNTCSPIGDSCKDFSLSITGSVFARQFLLNRTYVDRTTREPSEKFTADGRMQLNPPPGFADFAKGLPTFSRQ